MIFNTEYLSSFETLDDMLDNMPSYGAVFTSVKDDATEVTIMYERRCLVRGKQTRSPWGYVKFVKGADYGN